MRIVGLLPSGFESPVGEPGDLTTRFEPYAFDFWHSITRLILGRHLRKLRQHRPCVRLHHRKTLLQ